MQSDEAKREGAEGTSTLLDAEDASITPTVIEDGDTATLTPTAHARDGSTTDDGRDQHIQVDVHSDEVDDAMGTAHAELYARGSTTSAKESGADVFTPHEQDDLADATAADDAYAFTASRTRTRTCTRDTMHQQVHSQQPSSAPTFRSKSASAFTTPSSRSHRFSRSPSPALGTSAAPQPQSPLFNLRHRFTGFGRGLGVRVGNGDGRALNGAHQQAMRLIQQHAPSALSTYREAVTLFMQVFTGRVQALIDAAQRNRAALEFEDRRHQALRQALHNLQNTMTQAKRFMTTMRNTIRGGVQSLRESTESAFHEGAVKGTTTAVRQCCASGLAAYSTAQPGMVSAVGQLQQSSPTGGLGARLRTAIRPSVLLDKGLAAYRAIQKDAFKAINDAIQQHMDPNADTTAIDGDMHDDMDN